MTFNLRHLRLVRDIAATGSATAAAGQAFLTQPAVTQAVSKLEAELRVPLFQRHPGGLSPTPEGRLLIGRIQRALGFLDPALADLAPRLVRTVTGPQLRALIAVTEAESFSEAARRLGLSQPTVHRAITQVEGEVGRPLFERTPHGVRAARPVQRLAAMARLAFAELDQAAAELAGVRGQDTGRIVVGAMPLSRSCLLGPAISRFHAGRPGLAIRVVEGPFRDLLLGLRRGEIDWLVGALRPAGDVPDLAQEALLADRMAVLARRGHPLLAGPPPDRATLAGFPWVVAAEGAPARAAFDAFFNGGPRPRALVETGSLILLREVLRASDHLGFLSAVQAAPEVEGGALAALDLEIGDQPRPIGLLSRRDWQPTPAQRAFLDDIRAAAADLQGKAPIAPAYVEAHRNCATAATFVPNLET
jgi:LysR family transcriptional regulator of gallate degradation